MAVVAGVSPAIPLVPQPARLPLHYFVEWEDDEIIVGCSGGRVAPQFL
jgi:hypothetical protein